MINKEIYDKLTPYEPKLRAAKGGFVRIPHSELARINEIYGEITGTPKPKSALNCSHCVLNLCKEVYAMMEEYSRWYNARYGKEK